MSAADISADEARRIALAAQGFGKPRPKGAVGARHLRAVIQRLGLLQIDYVNVLVPAHYQVPFSRLGPYERNRLDDLVYRRREFTEQWAHEASIVPMETWPLLRHRHAEFIARPKHFKSLIGEFPDYIEEVLQRVERDGPLCANDVQPSERVRSSFSDAQRGTISSWYRSVGRSALEVHFARGTVAVADRRDNFQRVFDLAERIVPPKHHETEPERADAERALIRQAAQAHGIAAARDLADYFRMDMKSARARIAELVEAGELDIVKLDGWREPAYLALDAKLPRRIHAQALISPFDPLVWTRPRIARLFDFDYRIEIFMPKAKRKWGYYVLPFLLGDRLAARVDLKADRKGSCLQVLAAYVEPNVALNAVASALAAEVKTMAGWLGLETIAVGSKGDLAHPLAAAMQ